MHLALRLEASINSGSTTNLWSHSLDYKGGYGLVIDSMVSVAFLPRSVCRIVMLDQLRVLLLRRKINLT